MNEKLTTKEKIISWIFQIIAAAILALAAYGKFTGEEFGTIVFERIKMGAAGKNLIGVIESLAVFLLLTPNLPHYGAILGFGTMLGALLAHLTVLGIVVNNDGGKAVMMLLTVILSCSVVMYIRRKNLPFIGGTIE
jgi:hypothetical protein